MLFDNSVIFCIGFCFCFLKQLKIKNAFHNYLKKKTKNITIFIFF